MKEIIGKIPIKIDQGDDTITMYFKDGSKAHWYHEQDCCESVFIEDVTGSWDSLYGHPLLVAEERISHDEEPISDNNNNPWDNSSTWTFYTFRNLGGSVDVRWYGNSNGYYSESVDFKFTP